ncbi:MAG: tRNA-binding protein [Planctomycetes bacterium]|nr:tRNA-binding protein [Planctomycetota bacterium]
MKGLVNFDDFTRLDLRVGTVAKVEPNHDACHPAYILTIDLGEVGNRKSSVQVTGRYASEELLGRQVVCVVNFPAKRVAGAKSEVLVLAAVSASEGVVLLGPDDRVPNGASVG